MENTVQTFYGNRLRLRACGLYIKDNSVLLLNHSGLREGNFWAPPGGGVQFGEPAEACLKREMMEETGLSVEVNGFLFACEFIQPPLHAVELFFGVSSINVQIKPGYDPEPGSPSIIKEARFMSWDEITAKSSTELHGMFKLVDHPSEIMALRGYFQL